VVCRLFTADEEPEKFENYFVVEFRLVAIIMAWKSTSLPSLEHVAGTAYALYISQQQISRSIVSAEDYEGGQRADRQQAKRTATSVAIVASLNV
jgi:hypothetical protein